MIECVAVKGFKSLVQAEVELGRVNVFIGANGSGKSNFLEALGVLGAAASGRVDDESLLRRGVRPGVPALYKSSFAGHSPRKSIRLEARGWSASYSVELHNPLKDPQPAWSYKSEVVFDDEKKLFGRGPRTQEKLDPERGLAALKSVELAPESGASKLLRGLEGYAIYSPNTNTLRSLEVDSQTREPVGLSGGRLPEAVAELLKRREDIYYLTVLQDIFTMIGWAKSMGLRAAGDSAPLTPSAARSKHILRFVDRFMAEGRNALTGYDASEGALYVLFTAALVALPSSPTVFAIDNADHALNPRLARALMKSTCRWVLENPNPERQLLMTTHNPLVLDGLPLDNDQVRLFAVERSRRGLTTVRRVEISLPELKKDGEVWTVSRLWVNGHLGGVPNV